MFFDIIEVSVWDLSEEKDPLKLKVAGFARHFLLFYVVFFLDRDALFF